MARSLPSFVLALSLSLGAIGTSLPVAQACGGFTPTAEERAAIEDAIDRHFPLERFDDPRLAIDRIVMIDEGEADVWVTFDDGSPTRVLSVRATEGGWQVTGE